MKILNKGSNARLVYEENGYVYKFCYEPDKEADLIRKLYNDGWPIIPVKCIGKNKYGTYIKLQYIEHKDNYNKNSVIEQLEELKENLVNFTYFHGDIHIDNLIVDFYGNIWFIDPWTDGTNTRAMDLYNLNELIKEIK